MSDESTAPRRSRESLRDLVMEAAIDLVRREGLGAVSTTLSYQRVFDHLEQTHGIRVTRASVHERIWGSQQEFQTDVLLNANRLDPTTDATLSSALETFEATAGWSRWERMREMTRVAAAESLAAAESDPLYYSWVGMTMSLAKDSSVEPRKREALSIATAQAYGEIDARISNLLTTLARSLGLRPRTDLFRDPVSGWTLIVKLGAALSEGATLRTRFDPEEMPNEFLKTGPDGALQEWNAFAVGYWALLQTFLEEDPDIDAEGAD